MLPKAILLMRKPLKQGVGYDNVYLEVQYNPKSITMNTSAGKQSYNGGNAGEAGDKQVVQVVKPATTTMTVQLVFDDVNVNKYDASVQSQTEGLIGLMVSDVTRRVTFNWADMYFSGNLTNVSAKYTMFNKQGNPIRSEVELVINQGSDDEYAEENAYWKRAFDKAFRR